MWRRFEKIAKINIIEITLIIKNIEMQHLYSKFLLSFSITAFNKNVIKNIY